LEELTELLEVDRDAVKKVLKFLEAEGVIGMRINGQYELK
jgi:hypothetical protein